MCSYWGAWVGGGEGGVGGVGPVELKRQKGGQGGGVGVGVGTAKGMSMVLVNLVSKPWLEITEEAEL